MIRRTTRPWFWLIFLRHTGRNIQINLAGLGRFSHCANRPDVTALRHQPCLYDQRRLPGLTQLVFGARTKFSELVQDIVDDRAIALGES